MDAFFKATDRLKPVFELLYQAVLFLCKCILVADILVASFQVAGRYLAFIPDPSWTGEVILLLLTYLGLMSAPLAVRTNGHIRMAVLDRFLSEKALAALNLFAAFAVMGFAVVMVVAGWRYAKGIGAKATFTSLPGLSKFWMFFPVPLSGVLTLLFELEIILTYCKILILKKGAAE